MGLWVSELRTLPGKTSFLIDSVHRTYNIIGTQLSRRRRRIKKRKKYNLVEVVESLVQVGHHAGRRFVCNLDGDLEDALRYDVRLA